MKLKYIIITLGILLSLSFISAAMDPAPAYCEHMGYELQENYSCSFGDGNSCGLRDFYMGDCGQEYVKEFPCRKQGEAVFHFEECCGTLKPYLTTGFVGQTTCQPLSKIITHELKYNPLYWLGTLIVLGIIAYIIYKRKK